MEFEIKTGKDVCVIGAGAGGPTVAKHLSEAGLKLVLLEAGPDVIPNRDYNDLFLRAFMRYIWPFKRVTKPFLIDDDGNPITSLTDSDNQPVPLLKDSEGNMIGVVNEVTNTPSMLWGVGGTTIVMVANCPRAHNVALTNNSTDLRGYMPWDSGNMGLPDNFKWVNELAPYFAKNESALPINNYPMGYEPFPTDDAVTIKGYYNLKLYNGDNTHQDKTQDGRNVYDTDLFNKLSATNPATGKPYLPSATDAGGKYLYIPIYNTTQVPDLGYRGQPNCQTTDCWHCANCLTGCWKPPESQLKGKVKRATNVSYIPEAIQTGNCELRSQSVVIAVLCSSDISTYPHLVVYGTYADNFQQFAQTHTFDKLVIQPADVVVLAAGALETPRIWLQSNWLLNNNSTFRNSIADTIDTKYGAGSSDSYIHQEGNEFYSFPINSNVGKYFVTHYDSMMVATYDKPIEPWKGQNGKCRLDIPGIGMADTGGWNMGVYGYFVAGAIETPEDDPLHEYSISSFGVGTKEDFLKQYSYHSINFLIAADTSEEFNRVFLDKFSSDENDYDFFSVNGETIRVPNLAVQYHASAETLRRYYLMEKILLYAYDASAEDTELKVKRVMNLNSKGAGPSVHPAGTMSRAINSDCEAIDAPGIYVADNSAFYNSLDGPNTTHTCMALSFRTAEAIFWKHFRDVRNRNWDKWKTKVGTGHFI